MKETETIHKPEDLVETQLPETVGFVPPIRTVPQVIFELSEAYRIRKEARRLKRTKKVR